MDRQTACLAYITEYQQATGGVSPSIREIAKALGIVSISQTIAALDQLEAEGKILRLVYRRRAIMVIVPYSRYHDGNAEFFVWDNEAKALIPRPPRA